MRSEVMKVFDPKSGSVVDLEIPLDCPYVKEEAGALYFVVGDLQTKGRDSWYTNVWHIKMDIEQFPIVAACFAEWWEECSALRFEIPSGNYLNGTPECEEMRRSYECGRKADAWRRFTLKPSKEAKT